MVWTIQILIAFFPVIHGFLSIPPPQQRNARFKHFLPSRASSALFMNKKSRRVGGKYSVTKGGKKKRTSNKKSKTKSLHEKEVTRAAQKSSVVLPSLKSHAPPWQVLSDKDAQKNVQREKERRERIKMGLEPIEEEISNEPRQMSKNLLNDAIRQVLQWKRFNPSTVPCGMSFIGSYLDRRLPPSLGVPEVAFLGRSNVGKSSLLNRLSSAALAGGGHASDQARVGKTPGATASVNLYAMLGKAKSRGDMAKPILGLCDLPGFGWAKLGRDVQEAVQQAAERYLEKREELALGILLVDARREPSDDDCAVLAALYDMGLPLIIVATKVDKLSKVEREQNMERIRQKLGLPDGQPLCISSVTGEGTKDLWRIILEACEGRVEELKNKYERTGGDVDEQKNLDTDQLDEEGDPVPFKDHEDIAYDQGYDWIQGMDGAVTYEAGPDNYDGEEPDDSFPDEEEEEEMFEPDESMTMKNLRKRARDMERRGEV